MDAFMDGGMHGQPHGRVARSAMSGRLHGSTIATRAAGGVVPRLIIGTEVQWDGQTCAECSLC